MKAARLLFPILLLLPFTPRAFSQNVGIGTTIPQTKLHVVGSIRMVDGNEAAGFVPVSDANGTMVWTDPATLNTGDWQTIGNTGTTSGTHFIGTTDAQDLDFRANNTLFLRISQTGQLEWLNTGQSVFIGEGAGESDDLSTNNNVFTGYHAGFANVGGESLTGIGSEALAANVEGLHNTAVGTQALLANTNSSANTAIGRNAMQNQSFANSGSVYYSYNTAVGFNSLANNQPTSSGNGYANTGLGGYALHQNTTGSANVGLGVNALRENLTANGSIAIGYRALQYYTGTNGYNIAIGLEAMQNGTDQYYNVAIGWRALRADAGGNQNVAVGVGAMEFGTNSAGATAVGRFALANDGYSSNTTAIGYRALYSQSFTNGNSSWISGNTAIGAYSMYNNDPSANTNGIHNTAVGYQAGRLNSTGSGNTAIGNVALYSNTASNITAVGDSALFANAYNWNTAVGARALRHNTSGFSNTAVGMKALYGNTTGFRNTALGTDALPNNTVGERNTALGYYAMRNNTEASGNTAVGTNAMIALSYTNGGTSYNTYNTAIGYQALHYTNPTATSNGHNNTAIGTNAVVSNTTGNFNVGLGRGALYWTTVSDGNTGLGSYAGNTFDNGNENTFVGYTADADAGGYSNSTAIGARAVVGGSNTIVLGSINGVNGATSNVNVGIGTTTPQTRLQIEGGSDAALATAASGFLIVGDEAGGNIIFDNNEIMARNNGAESVLHLQAEGGQVYFHSVQGGGTQVLIEDDGSVGIGDITPAGTLTVGDGDKFQVDGTNGDVLFTDDQASITFAASGATPEPEIFMFATGTTNNDRMILSHSALAPDWGLEYQDVGDEFHFRSNLTRTLTIDLGAGVGIMNVNPAYDLHLGFNQAAKPTSNAWTVASDARLKTNVHDYTEGLSSIKQIRPVWFTYTGEAGMPEDTGVGILAQELQEVAPYMVGTWEYEDEEGNKTEYLDVDNGSMTYMLINAVKELAAQNQELQHELTALNERINLLMQSPGREASQE